MSCTPGTVGFQEFAALKCPAVPRARDQVVFLLTCALGCDTRPGWGFLIAGDGRKSILPSFMKHEYFCAFLLYFSKRCIIFIILTI